MCSRRFDIFFCGEQAVTAHARFEGTADRRNQQMHLQLEEVSVRLTLPRSVTNCALAASQGRYTFDTATRQLHWDIGKIDASKLPTLRGGVRPLAMQPQC